MQININPIDLLISSGQSTGIFPGGPQADTSQALASFAELLGNPGKGEQLPLNILGENGRPQIPSEELELLEKNFPEIDLNQFALLVIPLINGDPPLQTVMNPQESPEGEGDPVVGQELPKLSGNLPVKLLQELPLLAKPAGQNQDMIINEQAAEAPPIISVEQSDSSNSAPVLKPVKYLQAIMPAETIKQTNQVLQNGFEEFEGLDGLINVSDLEKLEEGECLIIKTGRTDEDEPKQISISKRGESRILGGQSISKFEISFVSDEQTESYEAILSKGRETPAKFGDLEKLISRSDVREAKLVIFIPKPSPDATAPLPEKQPPLVATGQNQSRVIDPIQSQLQIDPVAPRRQEIIASQPEQNVKVADVTVDVDTPLKEVSAKTSPDFGRAGTEQNSGRLPEHHLTTTQTDNFSLDSLLSRTSDAPQTRSEAEMIRFPEGSAREVSADGRETVRFDKVEFKLDLPQSGSRLADGGSFRIKLEPESLGKIEVNLKVVQDHMVARMEVDSPLAKQAVEANLHGLRETLHNVGIKVDSIVVNVTAQNDQGYGHNEQARLAFNQENARRGQSRYGSATLKSQGIEMSAPVQAGAINLKGSISLLA